MTMRLPALSMSMVMGDLPGYHIFLLGMKKHLMQVLFDYEVLTLHDITVGWCCHLQEAGITKNFAKSFGICVDHRRTNLSVSNGMIVLKSDERVWNERSRGRLMILMSLEGSRACSVVFPISTIIRL